MPRKKSKRQLIEELKTKIRAGHKQGWNPDLGKLEKELKDKYGIETVWEKREVSTPVGPEPIRVPVFQWGTEAKKNG